MADVGPAESFGTPEAPIWLIGDSLPANWEAQLAHPFDPRHPARHSIWTPVLEVVQREVYPRRVSDTAFFIRNAVLRADDWGTGSPIKDWRLPAIVAACDQLAQGIRRHKPLILISFGARSANLTSRALRAANGSNDAVEEIWTAGKLGAAFQKSVHLFSVEQVNHFPLLHATIARRHFLTAHDRFVRGMDTATDPKSDANAFEFSGKALARVLLNSPSRPDIWQA
ncbi:MAG: hypothetical protein ACOYOH_03910 [Paracraurococcus sp.]